MMLAAAAPTAAATAGWFTARRDARRLRARLHTDSLTGLCNRDGLAVRARDARWAGLQVGLLLLDLDAFKPVNDNYGHDEGNTVLRHVAAQLATAARPGETPARLHGDEFAVLLAGLPAGPAGHALAAERAAEFRGAVAEPLVTALTCHAVSASVGAAVRPAHWADLSRLLAEADRAMYAAKHRDRPLISAAAPIARRNRR